VLPPRNVQQVFVLVCARGSLVKLCEPLTSCCNEDPCLLLAVTPETADEQSCWNDACAHRSAAFKTRSRISYSNYKLSLQTSISVIVRSKLPEPQESR
jgi:hypothetical protein